MHKTCKEWTNQKHLQDQGAYGIISTHPKSKQITFGHPHKGEDVATNHDNYR